MKPPTPAGLDGSGSDQNREQVMGFEPTNGGPGPTSRLRPVAACLGAVYNAAWGWGATGQDRLLALAVFVSVTALAVDCVAASGAAANGRALLTRSALRLFSSQRATPMPTIACTQTLTPTPIGEVSSSWTCSHDLRVDRRAVEGGSRPRVLRMEALTSPNERGNAISLELRLGPAAIGRRRGHAGHSPRSHRLVLAQPEPERTTA
jgi:hypothetical protein